MELFARFTKFVYIYYRKHKIKGGIKLFKDSNGFLSCDDVKDISTEKHNCEAKQLKFSKVCPGSDDIGELGYSLANSVFFRGWSLFNIIRKCYPNYSTIIITEISKSAVE